jgi:GAF domain-containing protein
MSSPSNSTSNSVHFGRNDEKHQQKALQNFKTILRDLVSLFQQSSQMETVYMYWVNRARRQFVLEAKTTIFSDAVFQDRVGFEEHFLDDFKNLKNPAALNVREDLEPDALEHYSHQASIGYIILLPIVKNGETIAITAVESSKPVADSAKEMVFQPFRNALENLIDTFLEISDLYEDQRKWVAYEKQLQFLNKHGPYSGLIETMLNTMQQWLNTGGVSFVCRSMGAWVNVLNAEKSVHPLAVGTQLVGSSVARNALNEKSPQFSVHFNQNPKRLSLRENHTGGGTLAVPLLYNNKVMGIVLVYDENPLLFKESTKHKFINTARLVSLNLPSRLQGRPVSSFSQSFDAIIPDMWENTVENEIKRLQEGKSSYHTWVSLVSLPELSQIRTQLRLEDLKLMQKDLVHALNPGRVDIPGFIGFYADYRYISIVQSQDRDAQKFWSEQMKENFSTPFRLSNGSQIQIDIQIITLKLDEHLSDSYDVKMQLKKKKVHG